VLTVQPASGLRAEEELRAVGVRPGVGHGEDARAGVPESEILVLELLAVDGAAAGAVVVREVATLRKRNAQRVTSVARESGRAVRQFDV
jgi:hypothetical protein